MVLSALRNGVSVVSWRSIAWVLLRPTINSDDQFTLFEGERSAVSHSRMG